MEGFPTIFHVQGTETRPYTGKRTMQKVMLSKDAMHTIHEQKGLLVQPHYFVCSMQQPATALDSEQHDCVMEYQTLNNWMF